MHLSVNFKDILGTFDNMPWCCCRSGAAYEDISEEDVEQYSPKINERTPLLKDKNASSSSTGRRSTPPGKESSIQAEGPPVFNGDSMDEPAAEYPNVKVISMGTTPGETFGTAPQDWSTTDKDFQSMVNSMQFTPEKGSKFMKHPSSLSDEISPSPPSSPVLPDGDGDDDSLLVLTEDSPLYTDYLDAGHKVTSTPMVSNTTDHYHMEGSEDSDLSLPERPTSALEAKTYSQTVFLDDTLTDSEVGEILVETSPSGCSSPDMETVSSTKSAEEVCEDEVWLSCENSSNVTLTDNDSTLSLESPGNIKADLYGEGNYGSVDNNNPGVVSSVSSSPSELWKTVSTETDGELYTSCSQEPFRV